MTEIILAVILLLPLACAYFLKSNGALLFLVVCAGYVLVNLASTDIGNLLHRQNINAISSNTTNLILVYVPSLLTLLLARKHGRGQLKLVLSLAATICGGALIVLTTAPFLGSILTTNLADSQIWSGLQKSQAWIISAGALASFIHIWLGGKSFGKHK